MRLRVELDHGSLRLPQGDGGAPEAFVCARVATVDDEGERRAWVAWPAVQALGDARSEWSWQPLPQLIQGLLDSELGSAAELEAHVPAEVQEQLRRFAPETWQLLLQRTRLLQRGAVYRLTLGSASVRIEHREAGSGAVHECVCPIVELAARVQRGEGLSSDQTVLLTELVRARWLHERLPPALRWNVEERAFELRSQPAVRAREVFDASGAPARLILEGGPHGEREELAYGAGESLPAAVVAAGVRWVLDPGRARGELFLDSEGRLPRGTSARG